MNLYSDTQLHRDHCQWNEERASWHDDVRIWENEIEEMEAKLKRIEAALAQQKHDLQIHAAAIRILQERDGRREHALVQYEQDGNEEKGRLLANAHEGEIHQHQRQCERHQEVKARQRQLMTAVRGVIPIADHLPPLARRDG